MSGELYKTYGDSWKAETMSMRKADIVEIMAALGKTKETLERENAALRKVATIAADVNEWLIKIGFGGTGHQRSLADALKELEAVK